jgi:DNA/RNA endonuclease G (NUC1)
VLKENGIPIPAKLYKIIKCNTKNGVYYGAYENSNRKTSDNDKSLNDFEVRIEDV